MFILILSIVALIIGPLLHIALQRYVKVHKWFDWIVILVIAGIVIFEVLPDVIQLLGYWALLLTVIGFVGPTVVELAFKKAAEGAHLTALSMGLFGLMLHSMLDGAGLLLQEGHQHGGLMWAILLHRIPVGATIWMLLRPEYGRRMSVFALLLMAFGTVAGFMLGNEEESLFSGEGVAWLKALIAGSILHVIYHRPGQQCHHHHRQHD